MKRLRSSCGRPLTGGRPRNPLPVDADQRRRVLHAVRDEDDGEIVRRIELPLLHRLVDSAADRRRAARRQRVDVVVTAVHGPGIAAPRCTKKFAGAIGAGERLRAGALSKKTSPMRSCDHSAPSGWADPSARHARRTSSSPTSESRPSSRPETAPGGRSAMLPDLSSTSTRSNGCRPLIVAIERGSDAVIDRDQRRGRVAGVFRDRRTIDQRRGDDVRRDAIRGHVLRADESHRDVLLRRRAGRAEVGR